MPEGPHEEARSRCSDQRVTRVTRRRLGLIAVVLLAACLGADPLVEELVEWRVANSVGCAELRGVELDLGRWPVLVRALAGRLSDVRGDIESIEVKGLRLRDASFRVGRLGLSPATLVGGSVSLDDAEVHVRVAEQALTRFARAHGLPVAFEVAQRRVVLRPALPVLTRIELPARLEARAGAVVASFDVPERALLARLLPRGVTITPPTGTRVTRLRVGDGAIGATVRTSGRVAVGDVCA